MTRTAFTQPSTASIAAYEAEARRLHAAAVRAAFAALARRIAAAFEPDTTELSQA